MRRYNYSVEKLVINWDNVRNNYFAVFVDKYNNIVSALDNIKSISIRISGSHYLVVIRKDTCILTAFVREIEECNELVNKINVKKYPHSYFGSYFTYYAFI